MGALDDVWTSIFRDKGYVAQRTDPHKTRKNAMSGKDVRWKDSVDVENKMAYSKPTLARMNILLQNTSGMCSPHGSGDGGTCLGLGVSAGSACSTGSNGAI